MRGRKWVERGKARRRSLGRLSSQTQPYMEVAMVGLIILKILASMLKGMKEEHIVLEEGKKISNFFHFNDKRLKVILNLLTPL